ncbi:MAG: hypothetical protein WCD89_10355 [Anaerocolumna sp.]
MNDLIRRGTVTSVNYVDGTVKIVQEDRDDAVSFDLPLLSFEYDPPAVGDMVVAVFLSNDSTQGFILGKPFNANNSPKNGDKNIIRKDYDVGTFIEYDKRTKTLTIKAEHVAVKGLFTQEGDV